MIERQPVIGRHPVTPHGETVFARRVALVLRPAVLRELFGQPPHILVAVRLGQHRRRRDVGVLAVALDDAPIGNIERRTEAVAVDGEKFRACAQLPDRPTHPLERGVEDVDFVDAFGRDGSDSPRHRLAFDDRPEPVAVALAHLLRIVEQRIVEIGRQNHGRCEDRTGQTPPARFVTAGFDPFVLITGFQHLPIAPQMDPRRNKVTNYLRPFVIFRYFCLRMKFGDIIRQPLPVATFTFLVVVIVAFVRAWVTQRFAGEIPAVSAPLGYYTAAFRLSWPLLSAAASIVMLFVAGFLIGRSSVRAELYATRCFLAMPLFGVVSCGVLLSSDYLTQSLTLLLLALASRNYYNSFHRHYCFDRMFRGSLYVGLIPLLYAPGAGLLLLIPLVVLLFRRTLREAVVALSGAILPLFFAGFIHWAAGGRFDGPVRQVAAAITSDSGYRFFDGNTLFSLIAWGVIFFLLICSAAGVLLDIRTLKTKPRNILFYNLYVLCVVAGIYFVPYSSPVTLTLAAPAAATLIPVVLTKFNSAAASMFYTVLILLSLVLGLI